MDEEENRLTITLITMLLIIWTEGVLLVGYHTGHSDEEKECSKQCIATVKQSLEEVEKEEGIQ